MKPARLTRVVASIICVLIAIPVAVPAARADGAAPQFSTFAAPSNADGSSPPAMSAPSMTYDPVDDYSVLFGGGNANGELNGTWTFAGDSWSDMTASIGPPAGNSGDGLSMTYDAADGYVLLVDKEQTWSFMHGIWSNLTAVAGKPLGADGPHVAFDPVLEESVLFGQNWSNFRSYTWVYNHGVWQYDTLGPQPNYSTQETLLWDSSTEQLLLLGCNATWAFDSGSWTPMHVVGSACDSGGVNVADDPDVSGLIAYGGYGGVFGPAGRGETWTYANDSWTLLKNTTPHPPVAGGFAGMTYDPAQHLAVLFGGYGSTYSDQTWVFTGGYWTNVTAIPESPGPGTNVAFVGVAGGVAIIAILVAFVVIRRGRQTRDSTQ